MLGARMVDERGACRDGLVDEIARAPLGAERAAVGAAPAARAAQRRAYHFVELVPVQPLHAGGGHDARGHRPDQRVGQGADRKFGAQRTQRRREVDADAVEQRQRGIGGRGEIDRRTAACVDALDQQRTVAVHEGALAGNGGDARHLPQRACHGCAAALFEHEHAPARARELARDAGAAGAAADDDGMEQIECACCHTNSMARRAGPVKPARARTSGVG